MGVVRRYNNRYPHNNYYFSQLHLYWLFFGSSIPISLFLKCFSFLFMLFLCNVIINFFKIIVVKVCYYLIKIFLHNKIHFKITSIIYKDIHV